MLARSVGRSTGRVLRSRQAIANARTSLPTSPASTVRYASSSSSSSTSASNPAGGQNSLVVAVGALGVTFLAGYGLASGTDTTKSAKKQLETAAIKAKEQTPKVVAKKVKEASETVSSSVKSSTSSSSSQKSKATPPSPPSPSSSSASSSSSKATSPAVSSTGATEPLPSSSSSSSSEDDDNISITSSISDPGSLSDSESADEEAEDPSQAAFNPETGEINWDCPCLGGMAHGICGEQFREAFSCFVYSKEEPKGQDCIEKFRGMQECFAAHPEVYGEVMGDDDEEDDQPLAPAPTGEESDYDIISAVEKAIGGHDSK